MRKLIRNALNKCGFDLIRTRNSHDDLTEHLANVLLSRNIDCIFDLGANSGQHGLFLRELDCKGYIISFEPVSSVFKFLKKITRKTINGFVTITHWVTKMKIA
jgi:hypothetical protein